MHNTYLLSSGQTSLAKAGHVLNFIFSYTHKKELHNKIL